MHYDFIEIGTCDFDTESQKNVKEETFKPGISVEMVKDYLDRLPNYPGHYKLHAAIVPETYDTTQTITYNYVSEIDIINNNIPWWIKGCNKVGETSPVVDEVIKNKSLLKSGRAVGITLAKLFDLMKVTSLRYLKIDAEGLDCDIIIDLLENNSIVTPDVIYMEINELAPKQSVDKLYSILSSRNIYYKKIGEINLLIKT